MTNLIRNELYKVFHKKSIIIFGTIILCMSILNSWIYKTNYDDDGLYKQNYSSTYFNDYLKELNNLDPNNINEVQSYVDIKTSYDLEKLIEDNNFDEKSWQREYLYEGNTYNILYNINRYTYIEKDETEKNYYVEKLNNIIEKLKKDDWKYFVNEQLSNLDENSKLKKELLEYRLKNNVPYSQGFLNSAIIDYENITEELNASKDFNKLNYEEKVRYQTLLKEQAINKYIMDTKQNVSKQNNVRNGVANVVNDYEIFIIIFVVLVSSSIVSSEFKDGTIKLLLIKPYKRTTILLSKYITCLIFLCIVVLYTASVEFIVRGIFFGFKELDIPLLIYNYKANELKEFNFITYMLIMFVHRLPEFILLLTLSFSLSTLFTSTSLANTLTILGYIGKDILNSLSRGFNLKFMNYFVTLNWDLREYLYGRLPTSEGLTINHSITICLIYLIIMLAVTFVVFKKKNIKNI